MKIGLNLSTLTPFSREWIFADLRRQAKVIPPIAPATQTLYQSRFLQWYEGNNFEPMARNGQWARDFTNRLLPFHVLRFMDWQRTNSSPLITWSQRRLPTENSQVDDRNGPRGIAYELICDLCNILNIDPWICVPHLADDDYITRMANLFVTKLEPGRTVYLEYSNELWNAGPGFKQGDWVNQQTFFATPRVTYQKFVGGQLRKVFGIWQTAFSNSGRNLVRVVAGQNANKNRVEGLCIELGIGGFDAVSCAAYFDPRNMSNQWPPYDVNTTVDQMLADCTTHLRTRTIPGIKAHATIANTYNVPLLLYEAGQQLTAYGKVVSYQRTMEQVQEHPGIAVLYRELLDNASAQGVSLLCHYASIEGRDSGGMWGLWDDERQKRSTKGDVILDWIKANP